MNNNWSRIFLIFFHVFFFYMCTPKLCMCKSDGFWWELQCWNTRKRRSLRSKKVTRSTTSLVTSLSAWHESTVTWIIGTSGSDFCAILIASSFHQPDCDVDSSCGQMWLRSCKPKRRQHLDEWVFKQTWQSAGSSGKNHAKTEIPLIICLFSSHCLHAPWFEKALTLGKRRL